MIDDAQKIAKETHRLGLKGVKYAIGAFFALFLLLEDLFWAVCERGFKWIEDQPLINTAESFVKTLSPYYALGLALIIHFIFTPVELVGFWLLATKSAFLGILLVAFGKIVGTIISARLFFLIKPALMTLPWFARVFNRFIVWKDGVLEFAKTTAFYAWAVKKKEDVKDWFHYIKARYFGRRP